MVCLHERFHNASLCLICALHIVIVLCLTASTRGLHTAQAQDTVDIFPVEPTVLAGSNFNLTCTITESSTVLAEDMKWSRDGLTLPAELYSALDDKTSQLRIQDAQFQESGLYTCMAEKSSLDAGNNTRVYVGVPPSGAKDLSCSCTNFVDITCKWARSSDTNLNTMHTLQYLIIHESTQWQNCTKDNCICKDAQTCTILGSVHGAAKFRVMSSNKLGSAISAELDFDYEKQTVPYPPRNVAAKAIPRSQLNITWDLPAEWKSYYAADLYYKLEYYKEGSNVLMEYTNTAANAVGQKYAKLPSPDSLDAYTTYCVRVATGVVRDLWSSWSSTACNRTLEEKPDATVNATWSSAINAKNSSLRDLLFQWEPLLKANQRGIILGYRVINATSTQEKQVDVTLHVGHSQTSLKVFGLERYKGYRFAIEAFNSAGASPRSYLDITAEIQATPPVAVTVIFAVLGVFITLGLLAFSWYCVKHFRLLKPVPSISFIALDRFERVVGQPIRRGVTEKEVFDQPVGHRTPNGIILGSTLSHAAEAAARVAEDGEADYVRLREQTHAEESFPLLRSNSEVESSTEMSNSCKKLSRVSTDSANSSEASTDKELYSPESTVGGYGKFAKLYVQMPESAVSDPPQSGVGQPRLDSTDSGFGENGAEYRMPSYTKLSSIPSDPGMVEAPPGGEHDSDSDESGGDDYHRLANGERTSNHLNLPEGQSNPPAYCDPRVPSYTRLSSIPNHGINGIAHSVVNQELKSVSNGNLPNGTTPSIGIPKAGSS